MNRKTCKTLQRNIRDICVTEKSRSFEENCDEVLEAHDSVGTCFMFNFGDMFLVPRCPDGRGSRCAGSEVV